MRLVVQKVSQSSVKIEGEIVGAIDKGYMVLVGITNGDDELLVDAAKPDISSPLYDFFNKKLEEKGINVERGVFGAMMEVSLINDGPVTIILDSNELFY